MTTPDPRTFAGTSAPPGGLASRTAVTIAVLLGLFFSSGWFGYRAYLESPVVVSAEPAPSEHAASAERAVLFVVDAFTPAHAFDPAVMPTLARLAGEGASGIAQTGPVTTTAPCVYGFTTGRPGNLVQAIFNFHLNRYLTLALADETADPLKFAIEEMPAIPGPGHAPRSALW